MAIWIFPCITIIPIHWDLHFRIWVHRTYIIFIFCFATAWNKPSSYHTISDCGITEWRYIAKGKFEMSHPLSTKFKIPFNVFFPIAFSCIDWTELVTFRLIVCVTLHYVLVSLNITVNHWTYSHLLRIIQTQIFPTL